MRFPYSICLLLIALNAMRAGAEVRRDDSVLWRRAGTLAVGQQVFSLASSYQEFSNRFGAEGTVEPLGARYARAVTLHQLLKADTVNADSIRQSLGRAGMRDGDVLATSTYQVQRKELAFGFNWAYGLLRDWMIGVDVPVTLTTTRVQRQVDVAPQLSSAMRARIRSLAEQEFTASGYDSIPEQRQAWIFGDINLRSQEVLAGDYHWQWATQQLVRFPTAQNPSLSEYVQSSQDEGAVNLGVSSLLDYRFQRAVTGLRGGYVAQLPDSARMRARSETSSVDPKVNRDLGDWWWLATDLQYRLTRDLDLTLEYSYLAKAKDRYSGGTFSSEEYAQMAEGTDMRLHQTRIGMLYRIGRISSRAGVSNKWLAEVDYSIPWIGRNSSEAAHTSFEIINYF